MLGYLFLALIAFIAAFIITKIIVFIDLFTFAPFRNKKIISSGDYKIVEAEQITKGATKDDNGYYHLLFKYTVDGKEYKKFIVTQWDNDLTRPMYFHKNPKRAYPAITDLGGIEYPMKITVFLTVVIFLLLSVICVIF